MEAGSKLVDEAGRTLEEIVSAVKKVTDIVAEIAAASARTVERASSRSTRPSMQMDQTTQQNAALVEEAAAASQAIVEQAQALNGMIARYNASTTPSATRARQTSSARMTRRIDEEHER